MVRVDASLLELAEEPGLWLPDEPARRVRRRFGVRGRHPRALGMGATDPAGRRRGRGGRWRRFARSLRGRRVRRGGLVAGRAGRARSTSPNGSAVLGLVPDDPARDDDALRSRRRLRARPGRGAPRGDAGRLRAGARARLGELRLPAPSERRRAPGRRARGRMAVDPSGRTLLDLPRLPRRGARRLRPGDLHAARRAAAGRRDAADGARDRASTPPSSMPAGPRRSSAASRGSSSARGRCRRRSSSGSASCGSGGVRLLRDRL